MTRELGIAEKVRGRGVREIEVFMIIHIIYGLIISENNGAKEQLEEEEQKEEQQTAPIDEPTYWYKQK